MARVLDDIVHYFKQEGIDILSTHTVTLHCLDHAGHVMEVLGRRSYPEADLIRAVVEGEQQVRLLEDQLRSLWADRRRLTKQLAQVTHKE